MFPIFGRKEFASALLAGLHINVSVPSLCRKTAGIAILNPYSSFVPPNRRRRFADTLFTAVVGILSGGADSPEEAIDAFLDLAALERGWHPTNPGPLLRGRGYLEFRHLGSMVFQKRLEDVEDLCRKLIRLLSDPPMADVRRRAEQALEIAKRVRSLDTDNKLGTALSNVAQTEKGRFVIDVSHLENCGVFEAVYDICLSDRALSTAFPWIGVYDAYRKNPTVNDIQKRRKIPPQTRYFRSWDREPRVCLSGQESHAHPV